MAGSRVKVWITGDTLSASDLNAEFQNLLDNALSVISPLTGTLDANGNEIVLDADGDTSITADTDDQIDIRLAAKDQFEFLGTSTNEGNFTATDTDTGAAAGPIWAMYRNATGATGDVLGRLLWQGKDDGGTKTDFSYIEVELTDASAGTEDSTFNIWNTVGGTATEQWHVGGGIYYEGATDPGEDDIALKDLFVADNIIHEGDADNLIAFGTDTQSFETGGTARIDISDTGVRMGAANIRVTTILDEDAMGTDSDTALSTQQSIKAYVDTNAKDLEFIASVAIGTTTTLTVAVNDTPSISHAIAAGYDYIIALDAFAPTDDGELLYMRWSDDAGTSYEAGSDYQWAVQHAGTGITAASDTEVQLLGTTTSGFDAGLAYTVQLTLINPNASSEQTTAVWMGTGFNTDATPIMSNVAGSARFIQGTDAVTGVQFLWSGGSTFKAEGDMAVWRRKRS